MSYDIDICVKVEGCDKYASIAIPEHCNPTYNLGKMFRACMDWDFNQSVKDENGQYQTCYYPCDFVIEKVERGLAELIKNRSKYTRYTPANGWGTVDSAVDTLWALRACIYDQAEEIPLNCLYMRW